MATGAEKVGGAREKWKLEDRSLRLQSTRGRGDKDQAVAKDAVRSPSMRFRKSDGTEVTQTSS